jgi:type II secretory pathway component GspD/PulD (secretin)
MNRLLIAFLICAAPAFPARGEEDQKAKVMGILETTEISLDFKGAPLDEVLDFLHEVTKVNFVLSKGVLEKVKGGELKVDIKLENMQVRKAIRVMLGLHDLVAVYRSGAIVVETKDERASEVEMKMFDVRDLMMRIRDFPGPSLDLAQDQSGAPTVGIAEPDDETRALEDPDTLVEILRNATGGDAVWGLDGVSIEVSNGMLIVSHNPEVLQQLQELIVSLRQFK